jgi:c(7)-type cytochrome triheme protein
MIDMPETLAKDSASTNPSRRARRWLLLVAVVAISAAFILSARGESPAPALSAEPEAMLAGTGFDSTASQNATEDYSKFPHANQAHSRLPCLLCHRRENNAPQPKRSGHTPCAGCHVKQFAASSGPICTICHTSVEPGSVAVKPFPPLQSFNVGFDHSRHKTVGCATCHKPARRGVALSLPSGVNAHATCYQCHAPRAQVNGRDISSCGTCHKLGPFSRTPEWATAYRASFSHAEHARQKLSCNECHSIRAGLKDSVTSPAPTEHFGSTRGASCMSCHNSKRAFGEDFASCKRCHQGETFRF